MASPAILTRAGAVPSSLGPWGAWRDGCAEASIALAKPRSRIPLMVIPVFVTPVVLPFFLVSKSRRADCSERCFATNYFSTKNVSSLYVHSVFIRLFAESTADVEEFAFCCEECTTKIGCATKRIRSQQ